MLIRTVDQLEDTAMDDTKAKPEDTPKRAHDRDRDDRHSRAQGAAGKTEPNATLQDEHANAADDSAPGELLEGEGDPGLTLTGGSGHA